MKIKLFYSYSHEDESYREDLETHLATLRNNGIINEWHDRKIDAGDDWNEEIEKNISNSHIILLLFSPDFISSQSCQQETQRAIELRNNNDIIFIPIILRECAWKDIDGMSKITALPEDGKSINKWSDKDEAWQNVYKKIKCKVIKIRKKITPVLKNEFKNELLKNPIGDCTLDKLFVYPDILEVGKSEQKLENNEIDSVKLKDIKNFKYQYILIEGEEQSGKTSLCNMLYSHYKDTNFYPILINGKDVVGKANIKKIADKKYQDQYDSTTAYWNLDKEKRILIIDDINNRNANDTNYANFLQSINNHFEYAIIFIDELSNLSDKSTEHNYFYPFQDYIIKSFGHRKRDELIKKCIANDENTDFDINNTEQVARLDKDTKHINTIIGSNIIPSYPIIIISTFNIVETLAPQDMHQTSYGHCYHAMITMQLYRSNIKPENMEQYFNFLTEFAYFLFDENTKYITNEKLYQFLAQYGNKYFIDNDIINKLIKSNILIEKNDLYSFQYIYIYYYFVAQYIANHLNDTNIKKQIDKLMSDIHKKDNSNIIVFITHHTKNSALLDDILLNAMSTFEDFTEATLTKDETKFIDNAIKTLEQPTYPSKDHNVKKLRNVQLKEKDKLQSAANKMEDDKNDNLLLVEIRKSAKSMEIIGQIMKNQYGTFRKDKLDELFEEGQNVGLRLLKSFMQLVTDNPNSLDNFIKNRLLQIAKEKNKPLSKEKIMLISKQLAAGFSYSIIFGWLHKIVDSLGYDKYIDIANNVSNKTNTVASKLINLSIHMWYKKDLNISKLKSLYKEFNDAKNYVAVHILKDIVSRHLYMHKIDYQKKQEIDSLLGFSTKKQISLQKNIDQNK